MGNQYIILYYIDYSSNTDYMIQELTCQKNPCSTLSGKYYKTVLPNVGDISNNCTIILINI